MTVIRWLRMLCAVLLMVTPADSGDISLPPPTRIVLKNGLTVLMLSQAQLPLVAIRLVIRTGSTADPPEKEGLAAFTASLLKKGAGDRSAVEIADDIEFHGGRLDADHSYDATFLIGSFLSRDTALSLSLLADLVMRPAFAEQEIDRERERIRAVIAQSRESAGYLVNTFYHRFLYEPHPYSRPTLGTEVSISGLTRADITAFYRMYYVPDNAFLVIVGDIRPDEIMAHVERMFGPWAQRPITSPTYPQAIGVGERKVRVVDKPDMTQAHIRIGTLGIPRNHPDHMPILVANTILGGGGFTSRLVDEVRVNRGLTYDIESRFTSYQERGAFTISTFTRTETTGALVEAILEELNDFRDAGVSDSEVAAARQYLSGVFPLSLEGPRALAAQLAGVELFGLPDDAIQTYRQRVMAVTADDVTRVVHRYFPVDALVMVVLGNADRIIPQVEWFGPVERHPYKQRNK